VQQFLRFIILTFIYSSTCFERPHAHYQELKNFGSSFWVYLRSVAIAVLLVVLGPAGRPAHDQLDVYVLQQRSNGKTRDS
jgi:hypothetical protein